MDGPGKRGNDVRGNGCRDMASYFYTLWAMRHEGSAMSLMEKFLPHYQFMERHQTTVRCRPGELLDIIQSFEPPADRLTNIALSARQLPASLLHFVTRSQRPPPAPFTATNFSRLGRDGDKEIVGTCFTPQDGNSLLSSIAATLWFMYPDSYEEKLAPVRPYFFSEI